MNSIAYVLAHDFVEAFLVDHLYLGLCGKQGSGHKPWQAYKWQRTIDQHNENVLPAMRSPVTGS